MKQNNENSCNCFKWGRKGVAEAGADGGGNLTNVQCKVFGIWHKFLLYNEFMLIK
jgi:hypothetical protein